MRAQSVRDLKAEIAAGVRAEKVGSDPDALAFYGAQEPTMPDGVALGLARKGDEHVLAVRVTDPALAAPFVEKARGEAEVRVITVKKRTTPAYLQGARRPLEPGLQIGMADKNFVGTLGAIVEDDRGVLYALTNSHVAADEGRAAPGWRIGQPFGSPGALVGVLDRFVPFSETVPNLVDCALVRLDVGTKAMRGFNGALGGNIYGVQAVNDSDLGAEVLKVGRTTGARRGKITAVEVDGLPVGYDRGVLRFNDQVEVSGGDATDFSAPGDSGSLIVRADGYAVALLFAGGKDDKGEDFTYGNRLANVLSALGVRLAL